MPWAQFAFVLPAEPGAQPAAQGCFFAQGIRPGGRPPRPAGPRLNGGRPPFQLMITLLKKVAVKNGMPVSDISLKNIETCICCAAFFNQNKNKFLRWERMPLRR